MDRPWAVANAIMGTSIAISLAAFIIVYLFVFGAGSYYILRLIGKGPEDAEAAYGDHGVQKPPIVTELAGKKGEQHA